MVLLDWNDMESDSPSKEFGVALLGGTLLITGIAIIFAVPIGLFISMNTLLPGFGGCKASA